MGVAALGLAGAAQAKEFNPPWGYAFIDDSPFNDPGAGGALMAPSRVFPRGSIRDKIVDQRDVRLTVSVFRAGNRNAQTFYNVDEGDFENVSIDKRLDISPFAITNVTYDFCRFNPSNGVVEVCEPRHSINRPPEPTPVPTATPVPAPRDLDGDGVAAPEDCADQNSTVFPGAPEVPGNGLDDDCAGGDAPGRLLAAIKNKWTELRRRVRIDALRVRDAPAGALVEVTCAGRRCPFKRKSTAVNSKGNAHLMRFFKRDRLRPKIRIDVRVTYPNTIGYVGRFRIRRVAIPNMQRLCLPPGVTDPQPC
jgi:hypothetical protein